MYPIDKLFQYPLLQGILSDDEQLEISKIFTLLELPPESYYIRKGTQISKFGFLVKGVLKATHYNDKGTQMIEYFISENSFFSETESMFKGKVAGLNIQASTSCFILSASLDDVRTL